MRGEIRSLLFLSPLYLPILYLKLKCNLISIEKVIQNLRIRDLICDLPITNSSGLHFAMGHLFIVRPQADYSKVEIRRRRHVHASYNIIRQRHGIRIESLRLAIT